ncbi:MAG: ABC transporter ATP-binding protein [Pseudomonadota bacterium]
MGLWTIVKTGWALLGPGERKGAIYGLLLFCVSALGASLMVGVLFPFLAILADPSRIDDMRLMTWVGAALGLETSYDYLLALGIFAIAVIVLASALLIVRSFFITRFCEFFVYRLGRRLLQHYLLQPYPFFLEHHSGDLATNILSEADQMSALYLRPVAELTASVITVIAVVAMLIAINPLIAGLGLLAITTFYAALMFICRHMAARLGDERMRANSERFRMTNEAIGGIKDVKLSGLEGVYVGRFAAPARVIAEANSRIGILSDTPRYLMQTLAFSGIIVLCLALMGPDASGGSAGLGTILPALGVLALAAQRLSPEVHVAYGAITRLKFAGPVVQHLTRTLSGTTGSGPSTDGGARGGTASPALRLSRSLELQDVSYNYPNADYAGVDGVSCSIAAGETIGIVGSTGAGKTTLADVVLGLLPPQSGSLRVDGVTVDPGNVRAWQRSIAYVPQDIYLTDATVRENIALGLERSEIDEARVEHAARVAQLHDFIVTDLPRGYDTATGERGVRLSGGQRQRIGIARALYRDSDLIVLDEATSALDTVTERAVLKGIEGLPKQKTVIMIAHRLSTLRSCSRLFLMERGRIVAAGPWDVLMAISPSFRELVSHAENGVTKVAE